MRALLAISGFDGSGARRYAYPCVLPDAEDPAGSVSVAEEAEDVLEVLEVVDAVDFELEDEAVDDFTTVVFARSSDLPNHLAWMADMVPPCEMAFTAFVMAPCSSVLLEETPTQ